jgi:hypothetical protein
MFSCFSDIKMVLLCTYGLFVTHVCQLIVYIMDIFSCGRHKRSLKRYVEICGGKGWSNFFLG